MIMLFFFFTVPGNGRTKVTSMAATEQLVKMVLFFIDRVKTLRLSQQVCFCFVLLLYLLHILKVYCIVGLCETSSFFLRIYLLILCIEHFHRFIEP